MVPPNLAAEEITRDSESTTLVCLVDFVPVSRKVYFVHVILGYLVGGGGYLVEVEVSYLKAISACAASAFTSRIRALSLQIRI